MRRVGDAHDRPLVNCGRANLVPPANEAKSEDVRKVSSLTQAKEQRVIKTLFHHIKHRGILKILYYEFISQQEN